MRYWHYLYERNSILKTPFHPFIRVHFVLQDAYFYVQLTLKNVKLVTGLKMRTGLIPYKPIFAQSQPHKLNYEFDEAWHNSCVCVCV